MSVAPIVCPFLVPDVSSGITHDMSGHEPVLIRHGFDVLSDLPRVTPTDGIVGRQNSFIFLPLFAGFPSFCLPFPLVPIFHSQCFWHHAIPSFVIVVPTTLPHFTHGR